MGRVTLRVDHPHVLAVVQARLELEGFTEDTPDRRRLIRLLAGPKPASAFDMAQEDFPCTH